MSQVLQPDGPDGAGGSNMNNEMRSVNGVNAEKPHTCVYNVKTAGGAGILGARAPAVPARLSIEPVRGLSYGRLRAHASHAKTRAFGFVFQWHELHAVGVEEIRKGSARDAQGPGLVTYVFACVCRKMASTEPTKMRKSHGSRAELTLQSWRVEERFVHVKLLPLQAFQREVFMLKLPL